MTSQTAQVELDLGSIHSGSYEVDGKVAVWKVLADDPKTIDLKFRGRKFKVTQESAGATGRPRLLVNGFTQPDGKLLQGRSLLTLIRTLNRFWGRIIKRQLDRIESKMDVRFDRIEKAIANGGRRIRGKGKLCMVMTTASWPEGRYIPAGSLGGFSRVPLAAIPASQQMAAGEYRVLQAILFCAMGTGLLTAGKIKLAKLASVSSSDVKHFLRSLCNRRVIRTTGKIGKHGVREHELLTHPWLTGGGGEETLQAGGEFLQPGGESGYERGGTVPPLKTNKTSTDKTSNKKVLLAPDGERDLFGQIGELLGEAEMKKHGGMWRDRIRGGPNERRALRNAIEDYKLRTPTQQAEIRILPRWFTDRYMRNLVAITAVVTAQLECESSRIDDKLARGQSA